MTFAFLNMSRLEDWRAGAVNRNYHIVRHLVGRPEVKNVVLVDAIPFSAFSIGKRLTRKALKGSTLPSKTQREVFNGTHIWHISTSSLPLIQRQIDHVQKGEGPFFIWSFNPFFASIKRRFPYAYQIFDAVDDWTEHHIYRYQKSKLRQLYAQLDHDSDLIFTVSEDAKNLFPSNHNVHWIPNGVDCDHFQPCSPHPRLADLQRPIVGYHGIIEHRVDFNLVAEVARNMPGVSFAFVGPVWRTADVSPVKALPNVHFTGALPYQEIPSALAAFDVGWVPHRVNRFTNSMNPLKLLEYAAMEKPIVSTPVAGINRLEPHLHVINGPEAAQGALKTALETKRIPELRLIAKKRSWEKVADHMFNHLARMWKKRTREHLSEGPDQWSWPGRIEPF